MAGGLESGADQKQEETLTGRKKKIQQTKQRLSDGTEEGCLPGLSVSVLESDRFLRLLASPRDLAEVERVKNTARGAESLRACSRHLT